MCLKVCERALLTGWSVDATVLAVLACCVLTAPFMCIVFYQATYRPFLRQILEEVFHPDRPECPDIEHMSGGLTDLLKTGFSMFMKVRASSPTHTAGRWSKPSQLAPKQEQDQVHLQ